MNNGLDNKQKQQYLHAIYRDMNTTFDSIWREENNKVIRFSEYMKQYQDNIVIERTATKESLGIQAEEFIRSALGGVEDIRVTNTTDKVDVHYGADFKVQQDIDNKAASMYVDIKLNIDFERGVRYLHHSGDMVDSRELASKFTFSFGTVYFGIKEAHYHFFKYEKPVAVMYVEGFDFVLQKGEMNTLALILTTLNKWMVEQGYPYRASQLVTPNRKVFK